MKLLESMGVCNIDKVEGSALGDYKTINDYSEKPLEDLIEFVETLDSQFKEQGKELISRLENEELKL